MRSSNPVSLREGQIFQKAPPAITKPARELSVTSSLFATFIIDPFLLLPAPP